MPHRHPRIPDALREHAVVGRVVQAEDLLGRERRQELRDEVVPLVLVEGLAREVRVRERLVARALETRPRDLRLERRGEGLVVAVQRVYLAPEEDSPTGLLDLEDLRRLRDRTAQDPGAG